MEQSKQFVVSDREASCGAVAPGSWEEFAGLFEINGFGKIDAHLAVVIGPGSQRVRARVCLVTGKIWTVTNPPEVWMNPASAEELAACLLRACQVSDAVEHFKPLG